jgi:hypothetical protein
MCAWWDQLQMNMNDMICEELLYWSSLPLHAVPQCAHDTNLGPCHPLVTSGWSCGTAFDARLQLHIALVNATCGVVHSTQRASPESRPESREDYDTGVCTLARA